ncbi:MAG TPA: V-type ATPase 116kDa subunit family protein [Thermoplasmata archaeon]|nr:V-type ATPase 116kDa subunit family protein [Thermoplasmata archaeon]
MGLRPVAMEKVGLIGLRSDEERILTVLHDLRLAQIEPLTAEAGAEVGPERGSETLRRIGDETLRFRGLLAALPPVPTPGPRRFGSLDEVLALAQTVPLDAEVGALVREDDKLQTERKAADDTLALLGKLDFYPERLDLLRARHLLAFYGEGSPEAVAGLRAALPAGSDARLLVGGAAERTGFLVVGRASAGEALGAAAQREGIRLLTLPELGGTPREERTRLESRREEIDRRRAEIHARLAELAKDWYPTVAAIVEALDVENRKVEVLTRLGATGATFALEAWVPKRDVPRFESVLAAATSGRVHFTRVPTSEEPPTMMSNPAGVRRFEFFIRFYSLPQATEWDPTLVFSIVFPIFFGFMLGDWGYGAVILGISLWMIAGFPGARHLPKFGRNFVKMIMGPKGMQQLAWALLPGCAIAIGLGLFWDEFFGFGLLHTLVGYVPPVKPDSQADVGRLLLFAGYVGLGMVVLGFLFGALKEYFHHHRRGVLAKSGGILFAVGIAFTGLALIHHATDPAQNPVDVLWYALVAAGLGLLIGGEGIQTGMLGLIEVISHILSYMRLVGILLASVILALVINKISVGLLEGGAIAGLIAGAAILVIGQGFNVILGVFEPGIQGARLIFVEYFSKFYSGNGKAFRPFGAPRTHTVPSVDEHGNLGAILRSPEP